MKIRKKHGFAFLSVLVAGSLLCGNAAAEGIPYEADENKAPETVEVSLEPGWTYESPDGTFRIDSVTEEALSPAELAPGYPTSRSAAPALSEAIGYDPEITFEYRKATEEELTDTVSEIYQVSQDTALLAEPRAAVKGLELSLRNLSADRKQPFPYAQETTFKFELVNSGSVTAKLVTIELYIDGDILFTSTLEDIQPGYIVTITWPLSKIAGTHEIMFGMFCEQEEANYDNNYVKGIFQWEDVIDLAPYSIVSEEDPLDSCYHDDTERSDYGLPAEVSRGFIVQLANFGTAAAQDVEFQLTHNTTALPTILSLPLLDARKVTTLRMTYSGITKYESACRIGLRVDPNEKLVDVDRTNNYGYETFTVNYDTERWAGSMANANALRVQITADCEAFLAEQGITRELFERAVKRWNGISDNLAFVEFYWGENKDKGYEIFVTAESTAKLFYANTTIYKESGHPINDNELLFYSGQYPYALILINKLYFSDLDKTQQLGTIMHEVGHSLGLKHAFCDDRSIMKKDLNSSLWSNSVQSHDRANINDIY